MRQTLPESTLCSGAENACIERGYVTVVSRFHRRRPFIAINPPDIDERFSSPHPCNWSVMGCNDPEGLMIRSTDWAESESRVSCSFCSIAMDLYRELDRETVEPKLARSSRSWQRVHGQRRCCWSEVRDLARIGWHPGQGVSA